MDLDGRALLLYELVNGLLVDPRLASLDEAFQLHLHDKMKAIRRQASYRGTSLANFCDKILAGALHPAVTSAFMRRPSTLRALAGHSTADFLNPHQKYEVLHHSHRYPCPTLFLTSSAFNTAEGAVAYADYETCRRIVAYADSARPSPMGDLALAVARRNIPYIKWQTEMLRQKVTPQQVEDLGAAFQTWEHSIPAWVDGVDYPTVDELTQAQSVPHINGSTLQGVETVIRFIHGAGGRASLQSVFDAWACGNMNEPTGPESLNRRWERVKISLLDNEIVEEAVNLLAHPAQDGSAESTGNDLKWTSFTVCSR